MQDNILYQQGTNVAKDDKNKTKIKVYELDSYHRSNQDTSLLHRAALNTGEWVESGDLLADNSSSYQGELAIGKNILVAYMPWEGYNYEDSILINERLVYDDAYTSVHIERYEIEVRDSQQGSDRITKEIPDIPLTSTEHLDSAGIAKIGSWIEEGDILVGKVTPINPKKQTGYQRLIYKLFDKKAYSVRDSSLRAPKGIKANVINVQILDYINPSLADDPVTGHTKTSSNIELLMPQLSGMPKAYLSWGPKGNKVVNLTDLQLDATELRTTTKSYKSYNKHLPELKLPITNSEIFHRDLETKQTNFTKLLGAPAPLGQTWGASKKKSSKVGRVAASGSNYKSLSKTSKKFGPLPGMPTAYLSGLWKNWAYGPLKRCYSQAGFGGEFSSNLDANNADIYKSDVINSPNNSNRLAQGKLTRSFLVSPETIPKHDNNPGLPKGYVPTNVQIYLAEKRKIQVGDKMAGRHGNKGIISNILPRQDMPYLPDGTPLDIVLNPLGVPSRMNVGQIYECLLGLAGKYLGEHYKVFPFDEIYGPEASRSFVFSKLFEARKKTGIEWLFDPNSPGKMRIFDGRTSESFDQPVTVGIAYMLKLVHMVDDKIHMRSTGPYSLVTQQPLRGRAKHGGQRLGEMEVWAIEGYGAAFVLLEMLTLKSDDMTGRLKLWSDVILNKDIRLGTPESFKVLVCELQALCLDIGLYSGRRSDFKQQQLAEKGFGNTVTSATPGAPAKLGHTRQNLKEIGHLMFMP